MSASLSHALGARKKGEAVHLGVGIKRDPSADSCRFTDLFSGFDKVGAVKKIFGRDSRKVLESTTVRLIQSRGYLHVDNDTGDIIVCQPYLKTADERHFYLDLIHELVHVKQHHEGRELYDKRFSYVDRPTEIEAYSLAVEEAMRIGMTDTEIIDYLEVEWVGKDDFRRLLKAVGMAPKAE